MQRLRFRLLALAAVVAGFGLVAPPSAAHAARPPMGSTKPSRPAASQPGAKPKSPRPAAASTGPSSSAKIGLTKLPKAKLQMGRALGRKVKTLEARKIRGFELEPERPRHGGDWYPVTYAGLRMKRADDADGSDEPAVWLAFVRRVGTRYEKTVQRVPASTAMRVDVDNRVSNVGAAVLYRGVSPALLVSAIVEDDDGDSEAQLDALDDLLEQALITAELLGDEGDDPLKTVAGMLELGRPMLGPKATRPDFRVVHISEAVWDRMYDRKPKTASSGDERDPRGVQSVDYKLATTHNVGKGRYQLLIDLPHDPGHKPRRRVEVEIESLEVLRPSSELNFLEAQGRPYSEVCIGDKCELISTRPRKRTIAYRWMRQAKTVDVVVGGVLLRKANGTQSEHRWTIGLDRSGPMRHVIDTRQTPIRLEFVRSGTGEFPGRIHYHLSH